MTEKLICRRDLDFLLFEMLRVDRLWHRKVGGTIGEHERYGLALGDFEAHSVQHLDAAVAADEFFNLQ